MQEYSERNWPLPDMIGGFPDGWSEIVQEMLPANECDVCGPPLDIGPPPPLPANFQGLADSTGNCNVCHMLTEVEQSPSLQSDGSLLPIVMTLFVGVVLILITLIVLLVKVKKCRAFFPRGVFCWMFPRNLLPHTELAPSSLPSPSPSTEKLKGGQRLWHGSTRSIQSENIYEVCSPPSQDSLYEEVGPPPLMKSGIPCTPYGVVLVDKETGLGIVAPNNRDLRNGVPSTRALLEPNMGIMYQQQAKPVFVSGMPVPHFSTFGGSGRGFFNPAVRDTLGSNGFVYPGSAHTLGSSRSSKNATKLSGNLESNQMQKRKLPPVPSNESNFSL